MKFKVYFVCLFALLSSCSPVNKILESGAINDVNFSEKIPFDFDYGVPIITVNIQGKNYRFMFDTGTPTILSTELAAALELKALASGATSDSQGNSKRQQFVIIPGMKIGKLSFEKIGAFVIDLKKVFEFRCINIDGLIGANQMAKAVWRIDYQNKMLTASNNMAAPHFGPNTQTINFIPKQGQLTPLVPVKIGAKVLHITFDTGFSGDFSFVTSSFKDELRGLKQIESTGSSASGIYGSSKNAMTSYVKVPSFEIGSMRFDNQILEFSENSSNIVGNLFLQNYLVAINWGENKIYLTKQTDYQKTRINRFGVTFKFVDSKLVVSKIYKNSDAEKLGLVINDEVVAIDDRNTSEFTDSQACHYALNDILEGKNSARITILRHGSRLVFDLKREVLLD